MLDFDHVNAARLLCKDRGTETLAGVMRVRITRPRAGEIDGIDLKKFQKGVTYDVSPSLGTYLMTTASAELVAGDEPAAEASLSEVRFAAAVETFHEVANEMRRARRRKRR